MKKSIIATTLFGVLIGVAGAAQAIPTVNIATGSLWHVPEAVSLNAIPANVPGTTPDVIFQVNSPMNFFGTSTTVGTWLQNGYAFNITENTPGTLGSLMDDGVYGTLLEFTGFVTVTNGQQFTVTHDDGLTLIIGGLDLGFYSGPTAPTTSTTTYTGPSGNFAFQLVYGECCGGPAVLQIDLPFTSAVPEPETYAMFMAGLGLMGFMARRRKTS